MQIDQAIVLDNETITYADNPNNDNKEIKLKVIEEIEQKQVLNDLSYEEEDLETKIDNLEI